MTGSMEKLCFPLLICSFVTTNQQRRKTDKKLLCIALALMMAISLCVPVSAAEEETEAAFVPEEYTTEELLAMDQELDSDGDGLVDVIELVYEFNRYSPDTDGDGVNDYTEFCITCTDPLVPDGQLDTDGDGLTNAEEAVYGTNPDDLDTDNDTFGDYAEIVELGTDPLVKNNTADSATVVTPSSPITTVPDESALNPAADIVGPGTGGTSAYSGTLYTKYDGTTYTSSVSYTFNTNWFFDDNLTYNSQLAVVSSLLSAIAYDNNRLVVPYTDMASSTNATAIWDWMDYHGFENTGVSYDLDYSSTNTSGYQDQHVSEMFIGHKEATYGSSTKNIICIVIRGTNGTLDEWQSNFDLGGDSTPHDEWTASLNHMGFDITVNRLSSKLSAYMSANGLNSSNSILWFTGHSRGGALANLLAAKRVNAGYKVFAYTFASPGTTISTNTGATKYSCIFNIINEDDLVPQLPMSAWGFNRYGVDKPGSIEDNYASQWDALVSGSVNYTSNPTLMNQTIEDFANISDGRNNCYTYRTGLDAYYVDALYPTYESAQMSGEITAESFGLTVVAPYLKPSKHALSALAIANSIRHPHDVESYYLLSLYITSSE